MNILYLNDPSCVHSLKWITYFSNQMEKYSCFIIGQESQDKILSQQKLSFLKSNNIIYLPSISDFSVTKFLRTISQFKRLKKEIITHKIDLIHIMFAEPNALWALGKKYFGVPMILTTRGTDVLVTIPNLIKKKHPFNFLLSVLFKNAFSNFDFISSTSSKQQNAVHKIAGNNKVQTEVLRTGVYMDKILADNSAFFVKELMNKKYIFFPRYMNTLYNHDFSMDAIQLLPEEIKKEYIMVFIDANGRALGYIGDIKKRMEAIDDVHFLFLEELTQITLFELSKRASLVIMNPKSDGTPVSAIEAMAVETPVILGPLDYDEDIFNEDTVWKLKNWSAQELTDTIVDILVKIPKDSIEQKIKNAKTIVFEKANTLKEVQKIEKIYQQLVDES